VTSQLTRFALITAVAALAFASIASAGVYARLSANWGTPGLVKVTVLSDHSFNGTVENRCVDAAGATLTDATQQLTGWVVNPVAHQDEIDTSFDISAAGSGAKCTITVMSGRKLLAQQQFVSV
jgi:hypothetical protein